MNYRGYRIQKIYTIIKDGEEGYDYQFTLKDAKRIIDKELKEKIK